MLLSSVSFARLVAALRGANKTCTAVEQCCGGLISSSIMAQPGASQVYFGGSIAYNTKKSKPLLLNDEQLYQSILSSKKSTIDDGDATLSEEEQYIKSKLDWTAQTSVAFCEALETDYAIAEGGASGPTFRPKGMNTGFAVLAVAGRNSNGKVSVLGQQVLRSDHANREKNMRLFADSAADMLTQVVTGGDESKHEKVNNQASEFYQPAQALMLDRATHLRADDDALASVEEAGAKYIVLRGNRILVKSATGLALLDKEEISGLTDGKETRKTFLGMLSGEPKTAIFGIDLLGKEADDKIALPTSGGKTMSFVDTRTTAPLFVPIENELALHATALAQWQRRTSFCTLCGGPTMFVDGATCCKCTSCGTKSWPRQDPSMIAVISSRNGQRVLLAHSERHPPKLHTVLAGFVEVGETFEAAVAREAFEEAGVRIDEGSVNYVGSQPWPFPQSCMVGFTATADDTSPLQIDKKELVSAKWFDKADVAKAATIEGSTMQRAVAEAVLQNDPSIPLLIPPKGVIARKLIDLWLDGRKR